MTTGRSRARLILPILLLIVSILLTGCLGSLLDVIQPPTVTLDKIPAYSGKPYVSVNDGIPFFDEEDYTTEAYESYSALDSLGRCGVTMACIGVEIMPTEERGDINSVTPTGWQNKNYGSELVEGGWLYNRAHLIGHQLTGENANERNLITGTRYMNTRGMLPFENMVADYIEETENHVIYRVTPFFDGYNLLASGVLMEAYSVEDGGDGICFCVYVYNVQPGIYLDYTDGSNRIATDSDEIGGSTGTPSEGGGDTESEAPESTYVINTKTKKYHKPSCHYANSKNTEEFVGKKSELESGGYSPCGSCKP